ncbi:MAG TPA: hypothetical protein VEZ46_13315, partial [Mycobacteriales bacterium]|nr:hypothetical protein [Mycobacteriales bacterium]
RLAALPADTRAVLDVAAVIGREADLSLLAHATGRPVDECIDALEPALASRIFVPVPELSGRHRFAHALVHEAALAEVSSLRMARLHARVAEAIGAVTGDSDDSAEIVAGHLWAAAGVVGPAVAADALMRAAEVAVRRTAYETADDLLSRALQLRRAAGGSREASEAELLTTVRLVSLRRARHGYSRAYDATVVLDRADDLARRSGRQDLYLGLLLAQWGAAGTSGDMPTQERLAQRILALSEQSSDPVVRLVGQSAWGVSCWHLGRMREADARMVAVEAVVPELSEDDLARMGELDAASLFLSFCVHVRVVAGSIDVDGRFEELAERFTRPYDRLVVANFAGLTAVMRGEPEVAARWADWGLQNDENEGFAFFGGACSIYLGWARTMQGDPAGLALIERGFERFAAAGARTGYGLMVALQVQAMLFTGRPVEQARRVLDAGAREVARSGERFIVPYLELARARVAAAAGAGTDEVARHVRTATSLAEEMGIAPVAALAAQLTP